jgi:hypothetical protein
VRPKRCMGRTEFLTWKTITSEPTVGKGNTIYESEMALFFECMLWCARKVLDTADIVRDAILRHLTWLVLRREPILLYLSPQLPLLDMPRAKEE